MGLNASPLDENDRHPASDTPFDLAHSAALGFVAGLRSMMPLALLARQLEKEGPDIADGGWAIGALSSPWAVVGLGLAAAGELVADKLPIVPSRLEPFPLAGRVVFGGTAGAIQSLAGGRASDVGALVASIGAVLGSVVGYQLRVSLTRRLPVPGWLVASLEDALALSLGLWAVGRK